MDQPAPPADCYKTYAGRHSKGNLMEPKETTNQPPIELETELQDLAIRLLLVEKQVAYLKRDVEALEGKVSQASAGDV